MSDALFGGILFLFIGAWCFGGIYLMKRVQQRVCGEQDAEVAARPVVKFCRILVTALGWFCLIYSALLLFGATFP